MRTKFKNVIWKVNRGTLTPGSHIRLSANGVEARVMDVNDCGATIQELKSNRIYRISARSEVIVKCKGENNERQ